MTGEEFVSAIDKATTYEEAHEIVLRFQPHFAKMSNTEKNKWRRIWKKRKAELQRTSPAH